MASNYYYTPQEARARLLHLLEIYPALSASMINTALNWVDSKSWKPVLTELIETGVIKTKSIYTENPGGRNQSYTVMYRADIFDYPAFADQHIQAHRVTVDLNQVDEAVEPDIDENESSERE